MTKQHRINTNMKSLTISTHSYTKYRNFRFRFPFYLQILVTLWWNLNMCCTNTFATKCSGSITKLFRSFLISDLPRTVFLPSIVSVKPWNIFLSKQLIRGKSPWNKTIQTLISTWKEASPLRFCHLKLWVRIWSSQVTPYYGDENHGIKLF